ncbi:hypothetical protein [Rhodococcus sp. ACS1]|uniref:hypothetical protein n=1 Tax=Rhodococcus sp. ACS1 TaxID=2028570 RepID=UPI001179C0D6|nr:hypothetical protein [Rhodococcus sp. ACS1]
MTNSTRSRKNDRPSRSQTAPAGPQLYELLEVLGYRESDRVSVNMKEPDGRFTSRVRTVADLHGWTPPRDRDVWFGANPVSKSVSGGRRGTESDITRVKCVFADLDIKEGSLHTLNECREVVDRLSRILAVNPVAVVESGHGLQPFWRLASPRSATARIVETSGSGSEWMRQEWREVYARWGGLVQQVAQKVRPSAQVDNVFDLSRVLRCPGSVNRKSTPVPVVTRVFPSSDRISRTRLVNVLDRSNARPLGGSVGPLRPSVPTSMEEAVAWINAQPGAGASIEEMHELGPHRSMLACLDRAALVHSFVAGEDDESSAHNLMRNRVQYVVLLSTENQAGLVKALGVIESAYLELMRLRRAGRAPGEARSEAVALGDFYRAVVGAVAKARGRGNSPEPQRDATGRIVIRTTTTNGQRA